ncbi:MAG: hypothetical protein ING19_07605 [Azospirillum sp.]|nr:hypothetical protein [Azospirillum sp.]
MSVPVFVDDPAIVHPTNAGIGAGVDRSEAITGYEFVVVFFRVLERIHEAGFEQPVPVLIDRRAMPIAGGPRKAGAISRFRKAGIVPEPDGIRAHGRMPRFSFRGTFSSGFAGSANALAMARIPAARARNSSMCASTLSAS